MPSLSGSHYPGKEGWSPRATKSMFEVPQAHCFQRIKMVSILLEEKTRLEAQSGERRGGGGWRSWEGEILCPSFVSPDLSSLSRCLHLIVYLERPWINLPFGDCCSRSESALSGGRFIFFYL